VAEMTEEERERMRVEHAEFMEDMRRTWEAMVAAVKLVEDLMRQRKDPTPEQWAAADAARPSVERWRSGRAKAPETFQAMVAAVELVESLVLEGLEPSDEERAAAEAARASVERWRAGIAKAAETKKANTAAVKLVEDLERKQKDPTPEQRAAADAARASVERGREAIAKASAKAAEAKKAKLPAPTLVGEPIFFSAADRDFFC